MKKLILLVLLASACGREVKVVSNNPTPCMSTILKVYFDEMYQCGKLRKLKHRNLCTKVALDRLVYNKEQCK